MKNKIKILFVCKGNICRSSTAHGIFRNLLLNDNIAELFEVASRGTHSKMWHEGDSADNRSVTTAKLYDCDISDIISEQLTEEDICYYDYIIAMDDENIEKIKSMFPSVNLNNVTKLLDYAGEIKISDVPDPYYENNFEKVYLIIDTACNSLLNKIRKEHNI